MSGLLNILLAQDPSSGGAPVNPGFVLAFGDNGSESGDAYGVVYTSDNDINTWSGTNITTSSFNSPSGAVYVDTLGVSGRWVHVYKKGTLGGAIIYSDDDGVTWTAATTTSTTGTAALDKNIAWSPTLGLFAVGCNSGQIMTSSDGITWSNASPGIFGTRQVISVHWSSTLGIFMAGTNGSFATANTGIGYSADGTNWFMSSNAVPGTDDDLPGVYSIGSRVFVSNYDAEQVWYTDDLTGANTWTQSVVDVAPTSGAGTFAANSDGSILLWGAPGANSGGYVWRSTDNGVNFTRVDFATSAGLSPAGANTRSYNIAHDPDYGFMIGGGNWAGSPITQFIATSDDGLTWNLRLNEKFLHGDGTLEQNEIETIASKDQTIDI